MQTVHSLSEVGEIVRDDTVLGEWEQWSPEFGKTTERLSITRDQLGRYHLGEVDADEPLNLIGCIVALGDERFIELREEQFANQPITPFATGIRTHLFARLKIEKNQLTVWQPNHKFFTDAIVAGKLSGIIERRDFITSRAVVTSRADELRDFIASNPETAFDEPTVFRRADSRAPNGVPAKLPMSVPIKTPGE